MELRFNKNLAKEYKSPSQIVRVLTEAWVGRQIFCPNCGCKDLNQYENNKPVADFFCSICKEDYELKSQKLNLGKKIVNGAYETMIRRLKSNSNPNLFLLIYDQAKLEVKDFFVIPKHFFIPEIIEKRKPLSKNARRSGWVGCNILLKSIPDAGKIFFVKNKNIFTQANVVRTWKRTLFLREEEKSLHKGWILDTLKCIDSLGEKNFNLSDLYKYEDELKIKYPKNKHIRDKIRQQLQLLRDRGYLEFLGRGNYKLT